MSGPRFYHPSNSSPKYSVLFCMLPPLSDGNTDVSWNDAPWSVMIELDGVDLAHMQRGLFWTTRNMAFPNGRYMPWREFFESFDETKLPWKQELIRSWLVREFPDRPMSESRWIGYVSLFAKSAEALSGFSLGSLKRHMIWAACVKDEGGETIFNFALDDPGENLNRLPLGGDPFDLWWVWPMESVLPSWKLERVRGKVDEARGGRISWKDVAVSVARSESVRTVAQGIGFLLYSVGLAVSILVLSLAALGLIERYRRC